MSVSLRSMLRVLVVAALAVPAAEADLEITGTTFGWNPFTQTVTSGGPGPLGAYPQAAVNQEIQITFDQKLKKSSFKAETVFITSIPSDELTALGLSSTLPGGLIAPVQLQVSGTSLRILPILVFSGSSVSFGFVPGAYYRLTLKGKGGGVKSNDNESLSKTINISFRTSDVVLDPKVGPPGHKVRLIDAKKGKVKLAKVPVENPKPSYVKATAAPTPALRIDFNEVVLPNSVLNAATGASPSLSVLLDQDENPVTFADRIALPGTFNLSNSQSKSRVVWTSKLFGLPATGIILLRVAPTVEDLVGNSLFLETGDIGLVSMYSFQVKDGQVIDLPDIVEPFTNPNKFDETISSADWADSAPGFLVGGPGGGDGSDGIFPTADQADDLVVELDTEIDVGGGQVVPKVWNFASFSVPETMTVVPVGRFPLNVRSAGPITIEGVIDVSGGDGEVFPPVRIRPGMGGEAVAGGFAGGRGGSVTDGVDLDFPLFKAPPVFGYALPGQVTQGLTGLTATLTDFTVGDSAGVPLGVLDDLWVQPNVGTGSAINSATPGQFINHNHPTFRVADGLSDDLVEVTTEFGPMTQPGLDLYEFPPPPIAKVGDPFIAGDLAGRAGETSELAGTGGEGSLPLTVAQTFVTQVRAGGGGGGGSRFPGGAGENSPNGSSGSTGTLGGSGGSGHPTGTVASVTATTLTAVGTPFAGLDLDGGADPAVEPPFVVFPDVTSSYVFEIASHTDGTLTIVPIELILPSGADVNMDDTIDLLDVARLGPGSTFLLEPSFSFGGAGGGGSGVHCGGTTKLTPPPALTLPNWTPGSGGGSGGGVVFLESGGRVSVPIGGQVLAEGGQGGQTSGALVTSASGGGGGGGGGAVLRSGDSSSFAVSVVGRVSAIGGSGGVGLVEGGEGGGGRIRFESLNGNLDPAAFPVERVEPEVMDTDLGFFIPGTSPSVAHSLFYFTGALTPNYVSFKVDYVASINGGPAQNLVFGSSDAPGDAPFGIAFNDAAIDAGGNLDTSSVDFDFANDITTLVGPFVRFRVILAPSTTIGTDVYTDVKIDKVTIVVSG